MTQEPTRRKQKMLKALIGVMRTAITWVRERSTAFLIGYLVFAVLLSLLGTAIAIDPVFGVIFGFLAPAVLFVGLVFWLLVLGLVFGAPYVIYTGIRDREVGTVAGGIVGFAVGVGLWWGFNLLFELRHRGRRSINATLLAQLILTIQSFRVR